MFRNTMDRRGPRRSPGLLILGLMLVLVAGCGGGNRSQDNSGSSSKAPDNTGINARDSSGAATPMDQGGSEADRTITQNVRKMLTDSNLSSDAKNVKVITANGVVTLRGPVENADEKAAVERIASSVPGVTSVDNQLDVKSGS